MDNEIIWLPIRGYQDIYEISNNGMVRSLTRIVLSSNGRERKIKGKQLSAKNNGCGYHFVTLCKNGNKENRYIHRLVAEAFLKNPQNKPVVNHINGMSTQNNVDNLEWVDQSENTKHAYRTNLNRHKNANHYWAVGVIDNQLGKKFDTIKEWCIERGINYSTGRNILSGYNKTNILDKDLIRKKTTKNEGYYDTECN